MNGTHPSSILHRPFSVVRLPCRRSLSSPHPKTWIDALPAISGSMHEPVSVLAFASLAFALAGLVKGVIGLGLPTVAIGLLALMMAPAQAAALLVVPAFVTNVWQAAGGRFAALFRRMWPLLLGICAGTWAGAGTSHRRRRVVGPDRTWSCARGLWNARADVG